MIMELTTTSLGIAMGLGSASVLTGTSSSMDDVRRFFLSERNDIDSILENSRQFEVDYGLDDSILSEPIVNPTEPKKEDDTPSGVLGTVTSGLVDGVKAWFNYKYLILALVLGLGYKVLTSKGAEVR